MASRSSSVKLPRSLAGLRYFSAIRELLASLHAKYPHPNRKLHYDELVLWFLLSCFNPVLKSLRALQAASRFKRVHKRTGLPSFSLGSFSEAAHLFDPELVHQVFRDLAERTLAQPVRRRPSSLPPELLALAADATAWRFLPRMARRFYDEAPRRGSKGYFKGHFLFDILREVPRDVVLNPADERHVLPAQLQPRVLYVLDRGYCSSSLFALAEHAGSFFIARGKEKLAFEVLQEQELSSADRAAGLQRAALVSWHGQKLRLLVTQRRCPPPTNLHPKRKRGKHRTPSPSTDPSHTWVLLTNHFALSAQDVVLLYTYRWRIETFFRWLKHVLACQHFFSENDNGFALQLYATLIASLVVVLYARRKPNQRLVEAIQLFFMDWASLEDVHATLQKCKTIPP